MALSLKVLIIGQNVSKTMRFMGDMSVAEAIKEIREKTNGGGLDHGLFEPPVLSNGGEIIQPGHWLKENKPLSFYNLQSNSEVHFKKKHMPVKVKLIDDTVKTILIDYTLTVSELVTVIGEKMNVRNPEEYSLCVEKPLKGKKSEWLSPTEGLDEQGVPDNTVLMFKKKFFYSDANIDRDDPISLHLLYVQSRDAIIHSNHPTTRAEARDLAALQMQIVLGNYDVDKHKPGFMDKEMLSEFVPIAYRKERTIEKEIVQEWRKLVGMNDTNAKFRYLQLCRSLKTYGITSFEVKILANNKFYTAITGRNAKKKKERLLFGVTRDSIMFLDYETREFLKSWLLTRLKRWAATGSTSITLDFGDHEDEYITLLSDQAEEISNLIAGYIEIILKARREAAQYISEEGGEIAQEEEVARVHGTSSMGTTQMYISGSSSPNVGYADGSTAMRSKSNRLSKKQNITDLKSAMSAMGDLLGQLTESHKTGPGMSKEQWNKQLQSDLKTLTLTAQDLIGSAQRTGSLTRGQVDELAKKVATSVEAVSMAARYAAFAEDDNNLSLIAATKALTDSLREVLMCVDEHQRNPTAATLNKLKEAEGKFQNAMKFLNDVQGGQIVDQASTGLIQESNKAAQESIVRLHDEVLNIEKAVEDPNKRAILVEANKKLAKQAEVLSFNANSLAYGIVHPEIRAQLASVIKQTEEANREVMSAVKQGGVKDPNLLSNAELLSQDVANSLSTLQIATECADGGGSTEDDLSSASKELASGLANMRKSLGDRNALIAQTRTVAAATNKVVISAKSLANLADPATRTALLEAARQCAEAVSGLVQSAKSSASNPQDQALQQVLLASVDQLDQASTQLSEEAERARALVFVRQQIKETAAATSALIASAHAASADIHEPLAKSQLTSKARLANEAVNKLLKDLALATKDPNNPELNARLLASAQDAAIPAMDLVAISKRVLPKVSDLEKKYELKTNSDQCAESLQKLVATCKTISQTGGDIDEAMEQLDATRAELESAEFAAQSGLLRAEPGQSREDTLALLNLAIKQLTNSNNQLTKNAQENPRNVGKAAKDSGYALTQVGTAAKAVASTTADKTTQVKIVASAKNLTDQTQELIRASKAVAANRGDPRLNSALLECAQKVAAAMAGLLATSRGLDSKDVDDAVYSILAQAATVAPTPTNKDLLTLQDQLPADGKALQAAISQAVQMAKTNPKNLGIAAKITASTIPPLVETVNALAALSGPKEQQQLIADAKDIIQKTSILLNFAKATAADSSNSGNLSKSAKEVTDSLSRMMGSIGVGNNPEVEEALEIIITATQTLSTPASGSANTLNANLHHLSSQTKGLATATGDLVTASRSLNEVGPKSKKAALNVAQIISIARETLASGKPSAPPEFGDPARHVREGAQSLIDASGDSAKVVQSARIIAASIAKLIAAAKAEAAKETNITRQQALLKAAQTLANSTSAIAKAAKAMQSQEPGSPPSVRDPSSSTLKASQDLLKAGKDLTSATDDLLSLVTMDATSVSLSEEHAKKLTEAVRSTATATSQLISAAYESSLKPKDDGAQTQLSAASKVASEAIAALLKATNAMTPGAQEIEEAIEAIQAAVSEFDATAISVTVGSFTKVQTDQSHQDCQEALVDLAKELASSLSEVINSSRIESGEQLGSAAKRLASQVHPRLVDGVKLTISTTSDQEVQNKMLTLSKDLTDSLLSLMYSSRNATLNSTPENHKDVAAKFKKSTEALGALVASLKSGVILLRDLDECLQKITTAKQSINQPPSSTKPYVEAKDQLTDASKSLAASLKKLVSIDKKDLFPMVSTVKEITDNVIAILEDSKIASATTENAALKPGILKAAAQFASTSEAIVQAAKRLAEDPKNRDHAQQLSEAFKEVRNSLTALMDQVKQGAVGEIMCDQATQLLSKVIADLDTASLFAAAAQLEPQNLQSTASDVQKELLNLAKQTAASAQQLVTSTKNTQEQFGNNAKALTTLIAKMADETKENASRISNTRQQQGLLAAAKAIALSSQQLVLTGKDAQRFKEDPQHQKNLSKGAELVASSIQELISLTQEQELESAQGTETLITSRARVNELVASFPKMQAPDAQPEAIVKAARKIAAASVQLAQSNGAQDQIVKSCQASCESIQELLEKTKGAVRLTSDPNVQKEVQSKAEKIAVSMGGLMDAVKDNNKTGLAQGEISKQSQAVADGISELIESARKLPGGGGLKLEEDVGEDLESVASEELSAAVRAIEEATAALLAAKPPSKPKGSKIEFDTSDVTAAIFDAAIAISKATAKLVESAAISQRERLGKQKQNPAVYRKDPMWANGLISAAKSVAGATQQLVKSANASANGTAQEEELVAVARAVAAATAQLVTASKVKADPNSVAQQQLSDAAKTVVSATSALVHAAKSASEQLEEEESEELAASYTGNAVKHMEQQMKIIKLEKELEKARRSMLNSRKKEYANAAPVARQAPPKKK